MKTRAAILVRQNAPLAVEEIEIPRLAAGQVLVEVRRSGICGKQLDEISGKRGEDPYLPHLLGHEGAGVVREAGPGVRKVRGGEEVVLHWMKGSGIESEPPRFSWKGSVVSAGWVTTFSDWTVVSENRLTPIPPGSDPDVASLLGCAVTTGLGIVFNCAALRPGQSIAVFGVGGVGVNVLQGAHLVHAYPIAAVDLHDEKLTRAKLFGATHALNSREADPSASLMELTDGRGFDAVVDNTGDPRVIQTAYAVTSRTGKTILSGVPEASARITVDSFPLHFGRRILGVHGGDTAPDIDIPRYLGLWKRNQLELQEQITHRHRLEDVNAALDVMRSGLAGRCILSMNTSAGREGTR